MNTKLTPHPNTASNTASNSVSNTISNAASNAVSNAAPHTNTATHCLSRPPPLISDHNNYSAHQPLNHSMGLSTNRSLNQPTNHSVAGNTISESQSQSNGNDVTAPAVMMNFPMAMPSVTNDDEDDDYDT